ncbi:ribosome maturation factor RimP [Catalinimonas alkaloidigena]|uniref:ribosome assembly cofactor RimP n=1 Tax=Catalinimonas alkaloidigena TaxID=1075417 RepID=UPI002406CBCA|nr:ribosome assembly cofactor RimP [Catalinimonas alkaloidigena]MDF9800212.1 ribosome maturation factor RimP [Catalinimonas alkaloidigena]
MSLEVQIEGWVQEMLEGQDPSLFLVEVSISNAKNSQKVVVHLDGDEGISIDTCAEISRKLGARMEEENLISESFTLEVSSPGLDLPLKMHRQYKKNVGRNVKVLLQDNTTKKGVLMQVDEQQIVLKEELKVKSKDKSKKRGETKEVVIPFQDIKKTNVLASFK